MSNDQQYYIIFTYCVCIENYSKNIFIYHYMIVKVPIYQNFKDLIKVIHFI